MNVKYVVPTGVDEVFSLVWTPSGQPHEGYLWVGDDENNNTGVYRVDLEKDLKNVEAGHETQLQQVHNILPPKNSILPVCPTDDSTIFAISENDLFKGRPVLLNLDFNSI